MTYSSDLWPMIVAAICALLWILLGVIIMIALKSEKNRKIKHMKRAGILCWYVYSKNFLITIGSHFRAILAPLRYNRNKKCTLIWWFFFYLSCSLMALCSKLHVHNHWSLYYWINFDWLLLFDCYVFSYTLEPFQQNFKNGLYTRQGKPPENS